MGSAIPESVAKHMADLKNKTKAILKPSNAPAQGAKEQTSNDRSAEVADATSAKPAANPALSTSTQKPEKTPSASGDSIQKQLRELEAAEEKNQKNEKLRALNPTIVQPDIVVVERKKTMAPEVPDSVAAGRITAESLIESSTRRVQGQAEDPSVPSQTSQNIQSPPIDTSILQQVKAELEDPTNQNAKASPTRMPSISDYARSLEDAPAERSSDELQDPSDSTLPMERRPSNVRPVDIAKSLAEHDSVRGIVDDIRPNETGSSSTQIANQRAIEATIPGKALDNSLAGLMREARTSDPDVVRRKADSDVSVADLKPTSKTPKNPPTSSHPNPDLDGNSGSDAIPQQIRQLSDSISSFARPTGKKPGSKE